MTIFIDADACPKPIKDILFRAADKNRVTCILVANHLMSYPASDYIKFIRVSKGFDVADARIVELLEPGDLIVTGDIPLAESAIKQGGVVITPHGKKYTAANIGEALSIRNFMATMRDAGIADTKTKSFSHKHTSAFAAQLGSYVNALNLE